MVSHVYILRDLKHPRFKIGKANNILARARSFRWESIDFQQSVGLRLASEADAYILEKILHRTFRLAGVEPLEVIASGGTADGASEWFSTTCWPRLLRYLEDNQDLHPHEAVSGGELTALLKKQLEPSQAVIARQHLKKEKDTRRIEREMKLVEHRRTKRESLRASLNTILPTITDELDRLKQNGNIAGVCDTSLGSYLVIADRVAVPSGALLWSLKPLSTHYDFPGGAGSILSSLSQVTCLGGTVSKVELPNSYVRCASFSDKDEIIGEVFRETFEWLRQLQRIPEEWISVIFPLGGFFSPPSDSHECEYAIAKVMEFLPKSGR